MLPSSISIGRNWVSMFARNSCMSASRRIFGSSASTCWRLGAGLVILTVTPGFTAAELVCISCPDAEREAELVCDARELVETAGDGSSGLRPRGVAQVETGVDLLLLLLLCALPAPGASGILA